MLALRGFMNTQTETIQVDPSTAQMLRALQVKAEAQGKTLDELLQPLIEENGTHTVFELTPAERANAFREWANSHDPNTPVILDDSRDAIY
jgi:hypothetical protein